MQTVQSFRRRKKNTSRSLMQNESLVVLAVWNGALFCGNKTFLMTFQEHFLMYSVLMVTNSLKILRFPFVNYIVDFDREVHVLLRFKLVYV